MFYCSTWLGGFGGFPKNHRHSMGHGFDSRTYFGYVSSVWLEQ